MKPKFKVWDKLYKKFVTLKYKILIEAITGDIFDSVEDEYLNDVYELLQFTGIYDKNGNEIYEGDFLKCDYHEIEYLVEYGGKYKYAEFGLTTKRDVETMGEGGNPTWDSLSESFAKQLEIIGNKFEGIK